MNRYGRQVYFLNKLPFKWARHRARKIAEDRVDAAITAIVAGRAFTTGKIQTAEVIEDNNLVFEDGIVISWKDIFQYALGDPPE